MIFLSFCKTQAWNIGVGLSGIGVVVSIFNPTLGIILSAASAAGGYMIYDIFKNREVASQYRVELQEVIADAKIKVNSLKFVGQTHVAETLHSVASNIEQHVSLQRQKKLPSTDLLRLNVGLNISALVLVGVGAGFMFCATKTSSQSSLDMANKATGYIGPGFWAAGLAITFFAHHLTAPKLRRLHNELTETRARIVKTYNDFLRMQMPGEDGLPEVVCLPDQT